MENLKYKKKKSLDGRNHKITSLSIEKYQDILIKKEALNLSLLVRDLLDNYLLTNYPKEFRDLKRAQLNEYHDKLEAEKA